MPEKKEPKKPCVGKADPEQDDRADDNSRSPRRKEKDDTEVVDEDVPVAEDVDEDAEFGEADGESDDKERSIAKWREQAKKDLIQSMIAMVPNLVETHIMGLLEPMKGDLEDIRKRQIVADKNTARISKEVNALRVTGQNTQDQMAAISSKLDALTAKMEKISVAQAGSSRDPSARSPAPQASASPAGPGGEKDAETVALVFFPMEVGETMLKTHYAQVLSRFATDAARESARPRIGQLSNTFGIRFAKASHAEDFVAAFRLEGYTVKNPTSGEVFDLDTRIAGPKKTTSARGQCNSQVYKVLEGKFGKKSIKQKHKEEAGENWTRMSVSDSDGWVQHAVTIHYATENGSVSVARLVRGPRLDNEDSFYKELCVAAGVDSATSSS